MEATSYRRFDQAGGAMVRRTGQALLSSCSMYHIVTLCRPPKSRLASRRPISRDRQSARRQRVAAAATHTTRRVHELNQVRGNAVSLANTVALPEANLRRRIEV